MCITTNRASRARASPPTARVVRRGVSPVVPKVHPAAHQHRYASRPGRRGESDRGVRDTSLNHLARILAGRRPGTSRDETRYRRNQASAPLRQLMVRDPESRHRGTPETVRTHGPAQNFEVFSGNFPKRSVMPGATHAQQSSVRRAGRAPPPKPQCNCSPAGVKSGSTDTAGRLTRNRFPPR